MRLTAPAVGNSDLANFDTTSNSVYVCAVWCHCLWHRTFHSPSPRTLHEKPALCRRLFYLVNLTEYPLLCADYFTYFHALTILTLLTGSPFLQRLVTGEGLIHILDGVARCLQWFARIITPAQTCAELGFVDLDSYLVHSSSLAPLLASSPLTGILDNRLNRLRSIVLSA
ncbi:hypothetical protein CGC21_31425 [Leishmania donovani]|uniref:Uncharacterized protein n=1 Tax=Leishmania donovani TaxID=5661 RepID=A0A504XGK4_LEIDO|nr:hypothetical protein CGC21_31425 [Leishmania donovani]